MECEVFCVYWGEIVTGEKFPVSRGKFPTEEESFPAL